MHERTCLQASCYKIAIGAVQLLRAKGMLAQAQWRRIKLDSRNMDKW